MDMRNNLLIHFASEKFYVAEPINDNRKNEMRVHCTGFLFEETFPRTHCNQIFRIPIKLKLTTIYHKAESNNS